MFCICKPFIVPTGAASESSTVYKCAQASQSVDAKTNECPESFDLSYKFGFYVWGKTNGGLYG
jgi:hypothetical protein